MTLRALTADDRTILLDATLANMNWNGVRFSAQDLEEAHELSHYFSSFPTGRDFGFAEHTGEVVRAVGWLVFFATDDPGYGFVDESTPELSLTTFEPYRRQGLGAALLEQLITEARRRGIRQISLSVEDENGARRLYERFGFAVVGRNGGSDTMTLAL